MKRLMKVKRFVCILAYGCVKYSASKPSTFFKMFMLLVSLRVRGVAQWRCRPAGSRQAAS